MSKLENIDDLQLNIRARHCLSSEGLSKVSELIELTEKELLLIPNLGPKTVKDIKDELLHHGLFLKGDILPSVIYKEGDLVTIKLDEDDVYQMNTGGYLNHFNIVHHEPAFQWENAKVGMAFTAPDGWIGYFVGFSMDGNPIIDFGSTYNGRGVTVYSKSDLKQMWWIDIPLDEGGEKK